MCGDLARLKQLEANAVMQIFIEMGRLDRYIAGSAGQETPRREEFRLRVKEARLEVSRIGSAIVMHQAKHGCR